MPSSYDPDDAALAHEVSPLITQEQFQQSMRLVRLQIAVPISVLVSMGTNLVCALAIKPGLRGINDLFPTLLTPNALMIGLYWAFLYVLQVGFCLLLLLVRKDVTKEILVKGVGLRFAVANWLQAAWAVCFTLQFFLGAEVLLLLNVVNVLSILITLIPYHPTLTRPLDALFIHAPTILLTAVLFNLDWLHNGMIVLGWVFEERKDQTRHIWPAIGALAAVNVVMSIYEGVTRSYLMTVASVYLLFANLFSSPRTTPTLPSTELPKPTAIIATTIVLIVVHVLAILIGVAFRKTREREGRIRLEEEAIEAERDAREEEEEVEIARARARQSRGHASAH